MSRACPVAERGTLPGAGQERGASGAAVWAGQPADGGGTTEGVVGPAAGQTGPPVDKSQGWTFTKTVATDACLPGCGSSKHNPALTGLVQSIPSYFKPLFKHFLRAHKLPPAEIYHVAKVCRRQCGPALLVPMPDRTKSRWKASLIPALVKGPRFPIKTWNPLPRLSSWSRIDRLMGTTLSPTLPLTTRWSSRTSVHLRLANSPSRNPQAMTSRTRTRSLAVSAALMSPRTSCPVRARGILRL